MANKEKLQEGQVWTLLNRSGNFHLDLIWQPKNPTYNIKQNEDS